MNRANKMRLGLVAGFLLVAGATWILISPGPGYDWRLPDNVPLPPVPADNPMTALKVELGRYLFYDRRLSINGSYSCATCHRQSLAFTDGLAHSIGATGAPHPRSAMSLVNVAYATRLTWANQLLEKLEIQAMTPLFGEQPVEMGMAGRDADIIRLLRTDALYRDRFPLAFPHDADPYSVLNLLRATASFVRSIVSFDSPYDRYLRGDTTAMSGAALQGMALFFSERLECFHCHGGYLFTDSSTHADAAVDSVGFHNNGLYNVDGRGAYPPGNTGLYEITGERRDMGRFRAPSLRNIAMTAPYMHDGSVATLGDIIRHYEAGGRTIGEGPWAGDGSRSPYKSTFIKGFLLTDEERAGLLAFLDALSDKTVLQDSRFADPFDVREIADAAGGVRR